VSCDRATGTANLLSHAGFQAENRRWIGKNLLIFQRVGLGAL